MNSLKHQLSVALILLAITPCLLADRYPESHFEADISAALVSVEVDVGDIEPGTFVEVDYVGSPIRVYKRTRKDLQFLRRPESSHLMNPEREDRTYSDLYRPPSSTLNYISARLKLVDQPQLDRTILRSKREDIFVFHAYSTNLGCVFDDTPPTDSSAPAGTAFYSPCFRVSYDSAGRHLTNAGSGETQYKDLYIPPHWFESENKLVIGLRDISYLPPLPFSLEELYADMTPEEKLSAAAKHNDIDGVKQALKAGADITLVKLPKVSPFDSAILGGSVELIDLIVDRGARPTPRSAKTASSMDREYVSDLIKRLNR